MFSCIKNSKLLVKNQVKAIAQRAIFIFHVMYVKCTYNLSATFYLYIYIKQIQNENQTELHEVLIVINQ